MIEKHIAALKAMGKTRTVEAGWFASDRYGGKAVTERKKSKKTGKVTKKRVIKASANGTVGIQVAKVARIMEFGATITRGKAKIVIPARPFMRGAWRKFSADRKKIQASIAKQIIEKKITPQQALAQIGLILEGYIANSIRRGGWKGNAASTIARKGFDKPLIDTGHLWKSLSSKVS